jgi:hypothetical protein
MFTSNRFGCILDLRAQPTNSESANRCLFDSRIVDCEAVSGGKFDHDETSIGSTRFNSN